MRKRYVIGNWKMNGTGVANAALLATISVGLTTETAISIAVCPPYPYLADVRNRCDHRIKVGAQDVSAEAGGAFTGQVSVAMLKELGCALALVGHSERRHGLGESDALVAAKAKRCLDGGITPVVCVGELLVEREAGDAQAVVLRQLEAVAATLGRDMVKCVFAYEPVWAIGTGKTATPSDAQSMHSAIRAYLSTCGANSASILYGGSVKADNAKQLFAQPDIDGGLIGGAALDAMAFLAICHAFGQAI